MKIKIEEAFTEAKKVKCIKWHSNNISLEVNDIAEITGKVLEFYSWGRFHYKVEVSFNNRINYYSIRDIERLFEEINN